MNISKISRRHVAIPLMLFGFFVLLTSNSIGQLSASQSEVTPEIVTRSEAMAAYVVLKSYNLVSEDFRAFEALYKSESDPGKPFDRIAHYVRSKGLDARIVNGSKDGLALEVASKAGVVLIVSPESYVSICHPQTSQNNLVVTTAFNGLEIIGWGDWTGEFLIIGNDLSPLRSNGESFYLVVCLALMVTSLLNFTTLYHRKRV